MTLVLIVRHGLTAATGTALSGRTPGIPLDDRGRAQAAAVAERLSQVRLDAIISSPLERCAQTAEAIAAAQKPPGSGPCAPQVRTDDRLIEVGYGDWTGQSLRKLSREPLWRVVQAHPSAVTFPGPGGETLPDIQRRAVGAVRDWNARLGPEAVYLICSHADVIKAILADSLGLHLDLYQRIQVDPCSLSVIRYTPLRPFVERMNDTGGSVTALTRSGKAAAGGVPPSDAPVGGGAGG
ncbi:MAG TPA: MSMEG_4193 family putative phosphomutase [Streptosporangiaceae bacterium]